MCQQSWAAVVSGCMTVPALQSCNPSAPFEFPLNVFVEPELWEGPRLHLRREGNLEFMGMGGWHLTMGCCLRAGIALLAVEWKTTMSSPETSAESCSRAIALIWASPVPRAVFLAVNRGGQRDAEFTCSVCSAFGHTPFFRTHVDLRFLFLGLYHQCNVVRPDLPDHLPKIQQVL